MGFFVFMAMMGGGGGAAPAGTVASVFGEDGYGVIGSDVINGI